MSALTDLLKKLKKGITETASNAGNYFNPTSNAGQNFWSTPVARGLGAAQQRIESATLPKVNLQQYTTNIQAPVPRIAAQFGAGVAENILNIPQRTLEAGGRLGVDVRNFRAGQTPSFPRMIGTAANVAMPLIDIATLGGGTVVKGLGEQAIKQAGIQGLKQAVKRGAITGAKYGAAYGGLGGAAEGEEATIKNVLTGLGGGAAIGGLAGGATGAVGGVIGLIRKPPAVEKQLRDAAGKWVAGERPIKPKGMTVPQWEFQLKFNAKYGRNPYLPVMQSDLAAAAKLEAEKRVGLQVRDINADKLPTQATKGVPEGGMGVKGASPELKIQPQPELSQTSQPKVLVSKDLPQTPPKSLAQEAIQKQSKVPTAKPLEDIISISGGTNVKNKVGLLDYLRTPDRVLEKIGLKSQSDTLRKSYDRYLTQLPKEIDKITQWSKQVPAESNQRIFQSLDGQPVQLNPLETKVAGEIRSYLDDWATKLKLPADKRISHYITHIFEKDLIKKEFDDDLAKLIQNRVAGSVYDPFLEQRLGKMGYIEDTWRALDAYAKRATRKFNMDDALEQVKKASQNLEISQFNYVKNYIDRVNLRPTDIDNLVDNTIKQVIGYKLGARPTAVLTRAGRQMVYRGTLGLNPGSALKNLSQGANTYAKLGDRYTIKGYWDTFTKGTKELEDVGVLRNNFIEDRVLSAGKQTLQKIDKGLFIFFDTAEKINRGAAYYGAKAQGLARGMDEASAIEFGKKMVRDTQFTFGSIDTPVAMQGDIVKLLTQFQSYSVKQGEFLGEMIKAKDLAGLLRYGLAGTVFVSTIGKLIGMEPKDLIPSFRVGFPPTIQTPIEIGKAVLGVPDKYGNVPTPMERVGKVGVSLIPYIPAGVQIKKTIQGLTDVSKGFSETAAGRVKYPVGQDLSNVARGGLFGRYNLPEAREYRKEDRSPLGELQSELFKISPKEERGNVYAKIIDKRDENKVVDELKKIVEDDRSGYNELPGGRVVYWDEETRTAKVTTKEDLEEKKIKDEISLNASRMTNLKDKNDIKGWAKVANEQLTILENQLLAAKTEKEKLDIENKLTDLKASIEKYAEYGGFKKPKAPKKITIKKTTFKKTKPIKISLPKITPPKITAPTYAKIKSSAKPAPIKISKLKLKDMRLRRIA